MKRRLLFPIFAFVALTTAIAQPQFSPSGAEWWYGFKGGLVFQEGWTHHIYEKDTVVAGLSCRKLIRHEYARVNDTSAYYHYTSEAFVRQQGDSVFIYYDPAWVLRWRTNPNVGSTFVMQRYGWSTAYTVTVKVDSIKTVNLGGQIVKKIWQTGTANFGIGGKVVLYDKIGPESGSFDYTQCWGGFDCFPPTLCRYKDDQFPLYEFSNDKCELITTTHDPKQHPEVQAYPNPCQDHLYLDFSGEETADLELLIFDQTGRLAKALKYPYSGGTEISTKEFPQGVYQFQLRGKNTVYLGRFVKM